MRSTLPRPRMPRQREMASTIELSRLNITPLVTLSDALLLYWRTLSFFLFQHLDNAVLWKHKWLVHGSVVRFFTLSLCLWGPLLEAPRAPLSLILSTKEGYWGWSKIQDVTHKMWRNTGGKDKCLDYTPSSPSSRHEADALCWIEFLQSYQFELVKDALDSWDLFHLIDGSLADQKFPQTVQMFPCRSSIALPI